MLTMMLVISEFMSIVAFRGPQSKMSCGNFAGKDSGYAADCNHTTGGRLHTHLDYYGKDSLNSKEGAGRIRRDFRCLLVVGGC
jgi:hypothetical protein